MTTPISNERLWEMLAECGPDTGDCYCGLGGDWGHASGCPEAEKREIAPEELRSILTELAARRAANTHVDGWVFDRYVNGCLMAEGVEIKQERTLEAAAAKAARLASRGPNGETPVLVLSTSPALPSQLVGVTTFVLQDEIGEPDEWRSAHDELASWTGSAFLAGEKVDNEAELKGELYSFLCKLLGYLACGEEVARYAALASCLTSPAAEPVAWSGDHQVAGEYTRRFTAMKRVAEIWAEQGINVTPLYPAPSASREVTEADIESAAEAMWRAEVSEVGAARRAREAEYWADQSAETRDKWLRFARAALLAALPEREG